MCHHHTASVHVECVSLRQCRLCPHNTVPVNTGRQGRETMVNKQHDLCLTRCYLGTAALVATAFLMCVCVTSPPPVCLLLLLLPHPTQHTSTHTLRHQQQWCSDTSTSVCTAAHQHCTPILSRMHRHHLRSINLYTAAAAVQPQHSQGLHQDRWPPGEQPCTTGVCCWCNHHSVMAIHGSALTTK